MKTTTCNGNGVSDVSIALRQLRRQRQMSQPCPPAATQSDEAPPDHAGGASSGGCGLGAHRDVQRAIRIAITLPSFIIGTQTVRLPGS